MRKVLKRKISLLICVFTIATLAITSASVFATEGEAELAGVTYPIYESIEEAEAHLDNLPKSNIYYGDSKSRAITPDATMSPFFIRSGNTTKVQMYLNYIGKKPAKTLSIDYVEIYNDHLWLHPDRKLLAVGMNIYTTRDAELKVRFDAGTYYIPTANKKVRVDWDNAKVLVNEIGWVSASDPVGAYPMN